MGILSNLWKPTISLKNVFNILDQIQLSPHQVKSEKTVERLIANELREVFGQEFVSQQYSIRGHWGMKVDIDVGDGEVGIELKLANSLDGTISNVQRLFGQAVYYDRREYDGNLIIAVIGNPSFENAPFMVEIADMLEELGVSFIYITTRRKGQ